MMTEFERDILRRVIGNTDIELFANGFYSKNYTLSAIPKPAIINFELLISPPKYTGIKREAITNIGDLKENTERRMEYYLQHSQGKEISLFINVGGGIYSIGDSFQKHETPPGIIYPGDINSGKNQTISERFLNNDIPVININQIHVLTEWYELPYPPDTKYQYATGSLFYSKKQYNPKVILLAFIISAGAVLATGLVSHREIKERMHSSEPESII